MMNDRDKTASITISNLNPTHLTSNLDEIRLIYLDEVLEPKMILKNDIHDPKTIRKLDMTIDFFSSTKKCMDFIDQVNNEQIFLVSWAPTAERILPRIHHLAKLSAIFLFFDNPSTYHSLLKDYNKIVDIFKDQNDLVQSIRGIVQNGDLMILSVDVNDSKDWSNRHFSFLHDKLLLKVFEDSSDHQDKKQELVEKCRTYYRHDPEAMKKIDDFNGHYSADKAIEWYTNQSFLYKLTNRAFRTNDTDGISSLGFFIHDLCSQLESEKSVSGILYRGQYLRSDQIHLLEKGLGKCIAIKGFFFAHGDKDPILSGLTSTKTTAARIYQDLSPVLFEIHVNSSPSIIVAELDTHRQYLFGPSTMFRVDNVTKDDKTNLISVKMTTSDEGEKLVQKYMDTVGNDSSPALCFAHLLSNPLKNPSQVQLYFKRLLKDASFDDKNRVEIYLHLGDIYLKEGHNKVARQQYEAAMEICSNAVIEQNDDDFRPLFTDCWIRMSQVYCNEGDSKNALRSLKKATIQLKRCPQSDDQRQAEIHRMKGRTYLLMSKQDRKLNQHYWHDENIDRARRYINSALTKIEQDETSNKYIRLIELLGDLSEIHEIEGDTQHARHLLKERIDIVQTYLNNDQSQQLECIRDLCRLCKAHKMKSEALAVINKTNNNTMIMVDMLMYFGDYFEACEILFKTEPVDEERVTKCLDALSRQTTSGPRIEVFEKWLVYLQSNYSHHHQRTAYALLYLAVKHDRRGHDKIVHEYLKQSQSIFKHKHDRRGLRTIEDFQRHRQEKTKYRFHLGDTICHDMYVNGFAPSSMTSLDGSIFH